MLARDAFRKAARGQPCMIRVPGCNFGVDTVLAHYRMAGNSGTGIKPDDYIWGAWACSHCHDAVDGRAKHEYSRIELRLAHLEGVGRTQEALRVLGLHP